MKLADDITIRLGGTSYTLVPSLRYAIRLERRPGSFAALANAVADGSLSAAFEIIGPHVDRVLLKQDILDNLDALREPLIRYVFALTGIDLDDKPEPSAKPAKSLPFSEHLTNLFRIGTGWLGWTPDETLDATPAEIMHAYRGRMDMLRSIFGGEEKPEPENSGSLDDKFRSAFGSVGTVKVQRQKAA